MSFSYYEDPILGKGRAQVDVGSGGSSYVGGNGITLAGGTITATVAAVDGGRLTLSGGTATFNPVANIVSASGATVTLNPDTAYKVFATTQAVTLNANVPASSQWGLDGHIELFVAGTGYVVTGSNVVLANALEPDAVNNCMVRFHDGLAIISVEDHVAGYIVTVNAASGAGSLAYGLSTAMNEYISVDASLNGQTLDLAGATTYEGEKHVVGNGYTETVISGGITCTSKTTFSNLSMQNVAVNGGTMTLGNVFIPSGSTVSVSGGGLAIEKVTGDGGTIDLGGKTIEHGAYAFMRGCTIVNGSGAPAGNGPYGGAYYNSGSTNSALFTGCSFSNNTARFGGAVFADTSATITLSSCTISGNSASVYGNGAYCQAGGKFVFADCDLSDIIHAGTLGTVDFKGHNSVFSLIGPGSVTFTSGATLDLTGNTNATPIAPGGGIEFEPGGATVYPSAGFAAAYSMDNITLSAGAKLTNANVVDLGGTNVYVSSGMTASASGCTFSGGSALLGGAFRVDGVAEFVSCAFEGNSAGAGGQDLFIPNGGIVALSGCTVGNAMVSNDGSITLAGSLNIGSIDYREGYAGGHTIISSGASINLTISISPGGTGGITVLEGGCTVNGNAIPAGTYTSIDSTGTPTE